MPRWQAPGQPAQPPSTCMPCLLAHMHGMHGMHGRRRPHAREDGKGDEGSNGRDGKHDGGVERLDARHAAEASLLPGADAAQRLRKVVLPAQHLHGQGALQGAGGGRGAQPAAASHVTCQHVHMPPPHLVIGCEATAGRQPFLQLARAEAGQWQHRSGAARRRWLVQCGAVQRRRPVGRAGGLLGQGVPGPGSLWGAWKATSRRGRGREA